MVLGQVTVKRGVETEPLVVVTTIVPERAPTGIVSVIEVEVVELGVMFTPFNLTLNRGLRPDPVIVTVVPTGPVNGEVEVIRAN